MAFTAPGHLPREAITPTVLGVVSNGARRLLVREAAATAGYEACFAAEDLATGLEAAARLRPGLCVLDAALVEELGGALEELRSVSPETRVVVITARVHHDGLLSALAGGARGYVPAVLASEALARALADVLAGGVSIPRGLLSSVVAEIAGGGQAGAAPER